MKPVLACLLAALIWPHIVNAQNTMFLRRSPIAYLTNEDRQILSETIREVIVQPDGTVRDWSNPNTGSKGRVKVLDTHEDMGTTCRNVRARNQGRGRTSDGFYRLCLADDGSWKFAPTQDKPASAGSSQNPSP